MATDMVNGRVNAVMAELDKRQQRLDNIKSKNRGNKTEAFATGVKLIQDMISGEKQLIDTVVFDVPKTALEQHRNLQLATGGLHASDLKSFKPTTDAIDMMLDTLESVAQR